MFAFSSASRPPESTSTVERRFAGTCRNSLSACAKSSTTISVIRSCSFAFSAVVRAASIGLPVRIVNASPRSIRRSASSPQLRAISVAFDDHGEMVPKRGSTR